jgi:hypothetical protein
MSLIPKETCEEKTEDVEMEVSSDGIEQKVNKYFASKKIDCKKVRELADRIKSEVYGNE